jgi:hypothetical protein
LTIIIIIIIRWSRWCRLVPAKSTAAAETAQLFLDHWVAVHGPPATILTDGGPEFNNQLLRQICQRLSMDLHITTASHPQSHGLVERVNASLQGILRAFLHDEPSWVRLLPSTQFCLNTSMQRTTGVTPYRALHGFEAASPVSDALGTTNAPLEEPIERAALLASSALRDRINQAERNAFEKAQTIARRQAHGKTDFQSGEYVLVFNDTPRHKLDRRWTGPFLVDSKETDVTYNLRSLLDNSLRRTHVNRMHSFEAGDLTPDQLHQQARRIDEYDVTNVVGHRYDSQGNLVLHVIWDGYEPYDATDERAWCPFSQCDKQTCVQEYLHKNGLAPRKPTAKTIVVKKRCAGAGESRIQRA